MSQRGKLRVVHKEKYWDIVMDPEFEPNIENGYTTVIQPMFSLKDDFSSFEEELPNNWLNSSETFFSYKSDHKEDDFFL